MLWPQHDEPLTDALIGQGMMSLGGGATGEADCLIPAKYCNFAEAQYFKRRSRLPRHRRWSATIAHANISMRSLLLESRDVARLLQTLQGPKGWRGSTGTALTALMPTSLSATGKKSLLLCGSREGKRIGRTRACDEPAGLPTTTRDGEFRLAMTSCPFSTATATPDAARPTTLSSTTSWADQPAAASACLGLYRAMPAAGARLGQARSSAKLSLMDLARKSLRPKNVIMLYSPANKAVIVMTTTFEVGY